MKSKFIDKNFKYDGSQMKPLFSYLNYELLGDSIISWVGPCEITPDKIIDGEDLLARSEIRGSEMLHFIVEKFNVDLFSGVGLQRLLCSLTKDLIQEMSSQEKMAQSLVRKGDDLYFENKKLNISIATKSPTSVMIHFAVNISNEGTPVETLSLQDLNLEAKIFSEKLMEQFCQEVENMEKATQKVKPLQ